MTDFRSKFTKWYYRKGYRMVYKPCDYGDGVAEMIFKCPLWVRPLVSWFFSPSVYYRDVLAELSQTLLDLENEPVDEQEDEEAWYDEDDFDDSVEEEDESSED